MKGSGWRCERSAAIDETFAAPSAKSSDDCGPVAHGGD